MISLRRNLLRANHIWCIAALLWIAKGLTRAFAGLEKTPDFYLRNGFFWVKMGLFLVVFALEIQAMVIPFAMALMARGAWMF